jgi:hypothetical protein
MFYKAKVAVRSEIHTKHINTLCGHHVEFFNVKPGGTRKLPLGFKRLILPAIEQWSESETKTAKYRNAEFAVMKLFKQKWALHLPAVCVETMLSCIQECVKITDS